MRLETSTTRTLRFELVAIATLAFSIGLAVGNKSPALAQTDDAAQNGASDADESAQDAAADAAQNARDVADEEQEALDSATAARDQLETEGASQEQLERQSGGRTGASRQECRRRSSESGRRSPGPLRVRRARTVPQREHAPDIGDLLKRVLESFACHRPPLDPRILSSEDGFQ